LIGWRNRLTSAHNDRAALFRLGHFGLTIQVEETLEEALAKHGKGEHLSQWIYLKKENK
jgi:hypothetical protein